MDQDFDYEDLLSLSERILPLTSTSYTNNTSSSNNIHNHSRKSQKSISSDNQNYDKEYASLPTTANLGDVIELTDGTRKKYNGSTWRRMCSKANCPYYTQIKGLCKPHFNASKKRKSSPNKDNSKTDDDLLAPDHISADQDEPKKGDIITFSNGIRKKYDGKQYRRVCSHPTCSIVVYGSQEFQNGLCPQHFQEFRAKDLLKIKSSPDSSPIPSPSIISSSSRKRRRRNSPSSNPPSQIPVLSSLPKTNHRLSIAVIPPSVDINNPQKGDIIDMENGSRKKFDGVVWRKICSIPDCLIAAQRNELCRKHFIKLNGKPNNGPNDIIGSVTMVPPVPKSIASMSTSSADEKSGFSKKVKDESMDYDYDQSEPNHDNISYSYPASDDDNQSQQEQNGHHQEKSSTIDDHLDTQIDHTLINTLSASREKFPTNLLKKWLREHRTHPYPSNQEKLELARQSSISYDQVTTWFNNARAILRRRQARFSQPFGITDDESEDNDEISSHDNKKHLDSNHKISSKLHRSSLPIFNTVCCRSIGIQCNPSTANQTTSTSTNISLMTDDELTSDRTIKILTPSSHILRTINSIKRSNSEEFLINGIRNEDFTNEQEIVITSTCLDDDQMARLKEFCSRFQIKFSNIVDQYTTHLITDEEGDTLVCPLSKKVIQAVAYHMYIITYRWIDICLELNKIINEKSYEIQGDLTLSSDHHGMQRSRQSISLDNNSPKSFLLENYSIILKCDGCQEMLNNDELIELIKLSGAKHTTDSHFSRLQTGIIRVVLCEKEYLINRKEMYEKCFHAGVHFLTPEWFLESLVQYRIQPFQEYQITP